MENHFCVLDTDWKDSWDSSKGKIKKIKTLGFIYQKEVCNVLWNDTKHLVFAKEKELLDRAEDLVVIAYEDLHCLENPQLDLETEFIHSFKEVIKDNLNFVEFSLKDGTTMEFLNI